MKLLDVTANEKEEREFILKVTDDELMFIKDCMYEYAKYNMQEAKDHYHDHDDIMYFFYSNKSKIAIQMFMQLFNIFWGKEN